MHDVCLIGHVSRDIVRIGDAPPECSVGGGVHFAGIAYRGLGLSVTVLTKAGAGDAEALCAPLRRAGAVVRCEIGDATTTFDIAYDGTVDGTRTLRIGAVAAPFAHSDLAGVRARWIHLAPLTAHEMPLDVITAARDAAGRVFLDAQGFARVAANGRIEPSAWPDMARALALIDVLKVDEAEAAALTGERETARAAAALAALGPEEVIVTRGAAGSIVAAHGRTHVIAAIPPRRLVDATGCGDSYGAGYMFHRTRSDDAVAAGRFAAALATLALEQSGPFAGGADSVSARLAERKRH